MDKLVGLLQQIADKLGVTVLHLWPKVVLLEWAQSLVALLVSVAFLIVGLACFPKALRAAVASAPAPLYDAPEAIPVIKAIVFGLVLAAGLLSVIGWHSWIGALVSPEGALVLRALGK